MTDGKDFLRVLRAGRRKAYFLGLRRKDNLLLSLRELTDVVRPRGESYQGIREIRVSRIAGTEDRGTDFSVSFLPLRRSMERRWAKVRDLMLGPGIPEAIRAIEYGGYYFVRDGNHRVSVAKTHGIDFLDADVTRYEVPVSLLPNMTARRIPLFKAKADFHGVTHLFDYVSEADVGDAHPETWQLLQNVVLPRYREILAERNGRPPGPGEAEKDLFEGPIATLTGAIRKQAISTLFPGRYDLDICCDVIRAARLDPLSTPPAEALAELIERRRRGHVPRALLHNVRRRIAWLTSTDKEEYDHFLRMTRLHTFCPKATIVEGRKDWYRFLTRQVLVSHFGYLAQEVGRVPAIGELVRSWYADLYLPARRLHEQRSITTPFPVFYMRWMASWQGQTLRAVRRYGYAKRIGLEESLDAFLSASDARR
jgi:hypothetical protein